MARLVQYMDDDGVVHMRMIEDPPKLKVVPCRAHADFSDKQED